VKSHDLRRLKAAVRINTILLLIVLLLTVILPTAVVLLRPRARRSRPRISTFSLFQPILLSAVDLTAVGSIQLS